jgi:hypothetical protein
MLYLNLNKQSNAWMQYQLLNKSSRWWFPLFLN